ncbi:uncharacterized protein ACLA_062070 [Aspergillus clavatus NRRL 1]|uniref:Uncharacterized protein n=1 Tax=Aspergillus clavatus (strain ATCC 1007 / CBS 513.65 / DSM 816 / NCTC 3887 / NRRL 1 / QM 1276 / 107) TaxID=344612 RepID=A1CCI7_ASPCL|nr:uncharacterized protein ACLA_062070 [Aspergillus clavatus NRRL 1]EAW12244.1 hypothetical protein ACLA_062070 [Aspergillus clavatus NRRL 1]
MRQRSRSRIALSNDLDLRGNEGAVDLVFELVREFFAKSQISITEIQFWGRVIVIVLENESNKEKDLAAVPRSIGQCNCFYLFESDMARPKSFSTAPLRQCFASQIDDSEYETIRPGVVVSSGTHPQEGWEILTSSGILISDHLGSQYMTVAAHGFPGPFEGKVFHPQSSGRAIGEVIVQISHTDVALVQLGQGVHFINEPFENTIIPAPPSRLEGFLRAAATRIGGNIFMDSPFSGFMEGTRGAHSLLRIPSDDPLEPKQSWIRCQWDYMGQGSYAAMVDGVHGSAIWDDNQNVLGFFRYAPQSGPFLDWCMSISADHLLDKGYTMV